MALYFDYRMADSDRTDHKRNQAAVLSESILQGLLWPQETGPCGRETKSRKIYTFRREMSS